jgi:hypothetical protein
MTSSEQRTSLNCLCFGRTYFLAFRDLNMFTRTTIAFAMILGLSAGAFAETKKPAHSSNPAFDVYDSRGNYVGSDPDSRIRMEIMRQGRGSTE